MLFLLSRGRRSRVLFKLFAELVAGGLVVLLALLVIRSDLRGKPVQVQQNLQNVKEVQGVSKVNAGLPVRLKIPRINADAPIDPVGVTASSDMQAPEGPRNVGWYKDGPRPGDTGNAVLAGHYGRWENGENSVFDDLNKLNLGDEVLVEDEKGATTVFIVSNLQTYNYDEDAQSVFVSKDGKAHLNIITCQGTWDESQKTYTQRLVVFADRQ